MRKLSLVLAMLLSLSLCSGVQAETEDTTPAGGTQFKQEYEIMNGQSNMDGTNTYQELNLPEDISVEYADETSLDALFTDGTGVLYLGFPECPWCRTLVPVLFEAAQTSGYTNPILYYNAVDDRDRKSLDEDGNIVTEKEGTEMYTRLLGYLDEHLGAYEGLNDDTIKRLYFPTTVFVKNGEIICVHIDTIEGQEEGYEPLTEQQHSDLLTLLADQFALLAE